MDIEEQWRDVVGWEGLYEVSNMGKVRSIDRTIEDGRRYKGRELKPWFNEGRARVTLPGKTKVKIHRLVCEAFNGPPPEGKMFALHRNGNSLDNRAENLYWGDFKDNVADALRHGTHARVKSLITKCPQGHSYSGDNLYTPPGTNYRQCRVCRADATRRMNEKRKRERRERG